jgi:archaeal type IV pilus assembly protein PilA
LKKLTQLPSSKSKAISPIIATLLLILIAIAAGVVVYAYVIGFVGNSTTGPGNTQGVISIDNFCASSLSHCGGDNYTVAIRNVGSTTIPAGTVNLYFTDLTSGKAGTYTCPISAGGLAPSSTLSGCTIASYPVGLSTTAKGDSMSLKAVTPDGSQATASTKVI